MNFYRTGLYVRTHTHTHTHTHTFSVPEDQQTAEECAGHKHAIRRRIGGLLTVTGGLFLLSFFFNPPPPPIFLVRVVCKDTETFDWRSPQRPTYTAALMDTSSQPRLNSCLFCQLLCSSRLFVLPACNFVIFLVIIFVLSRVCVLCKKKERKKGGVALVPGFQLSTHDQRSAQSVDRDDHRVHTPRLKNVHSRVRDRYILRKRGR